MDPTIRAYARKRASLCRVFGNTRRVLIVWALGDREMSVSAIAAAVDTSLQNTSQQLRIMKDKGILESRRDGISIFYRLADNKLTRNCPVLQGVEQYNVNQNGSVLVNDLEDSDD